MSLLKNLLNNHYTDGKLTWIGLRSKRLMPLSIVTTALITENGLEGDHFVSNVNSAMSGKRAITLIQSEHMPVIAALCGKEKIVPEELRRNLVVSGINLSSFRNRVIELGEILLEITGPCAPCSRMEEILGPGGYNAMRGHGGWTARVIKGGIINIGDSVRLFN